MVGFGALAWATDLGTAIVASGLAMMVLGPLVAARFTERHFTPAREHRWRKSLTIFRRSVLLARRDREILLVFAATLLVNGAAEGFGRLYPRQLVELGLSEKPEPIVWLTALGLVTLAVGAFALRVVEARIDGVAVAPRAYAAACFIGALGLIVLAYAPDEVTGMAGVLLVAGIAEPVTRPSASCGSIVAPPATCERRCNRSWPRPSIWARSPWDSASASSPRRRASASR